MAEIKDDYGELWQKYIKTRDIEIKNELVLNYLHLVKRIVLRMMPVYQNFNEYDDLVSYGVLGLMDAIERFDPDQGVKFTTYATLRIRGDIIDHMRKKDWAPSSLRRKITAVSDAFNDLQSKLFRQPSEQDVANHLGMDVKEVREVLEKSYIFNILHFEDILTENSTVKEPATPEEANPANIAEKKEVNDILANVIETLPEKERLVISLYYYEEMTLKEIASILQVSESRISQIHSKVLLKLRQKMEYEFNA